MITKETAGRIWNCYHEIETGEKLATEMKDALASGEDPNPLDASGKRRMLQFGVPFGKDSRRLIDVAPTLAISVITAHVENQRAELVEANEQARIELGGHPAEKE